MRIHEVAALTGVTVRTLHHYDAIGLLKPDAVSASGYRDYSEKNLESLQQILFFRELGFPLGEIREIRKNPGYDEWEALGKHRELLLLKKQRLDRLITLVNDTLTQHKKGEQTMDFKAFDSADIEAARTRYADEVKERWGGTEAYSESEKKTAGYGKEQWQALGEGANEIFAAFAAAKPQGPESETAQALVKQWQDYISKNYYACTKEILAGLGQMYVCDERFTKNLDAFGAGTAQFMADAIAHYCK